MYWWIALQSLWEHTGMEKYVCEMAKMQYCVETEAKFSVC